MKDDHELIVLAAYDDLDAAKSDFEDVERGRKHSLELRAAALVTKNAEGHRRCWKRRTSTVDWAPGWVPD